MLNVVPTLSHDAENVVGFIDRGEVGHNEFLKAKRRACRGMYPEV